MKTHRASELDMSVATSLLKKILAFKRVILRGYVAFRLAVRGLKLPRIHLALLGVSAAVFITTAFSLVSDNSKSKFEAGSFQTELMALPSPNPVSEGPSNEPELDKSEIIKHEIKNGENLALIGEKYEIRPVDIHYLSSQKPHGKLLRKIRPGEMLSFTFDKEKLLLRVDYQPDPLTIITFDRDDKSFNSSSNSITPTREILFSHGVIEQNLFYASQKIGLADALTMRLAQIFQWDIDFVLDLRPGDSFFLMYEELFVNDKFVGHGDILAAEFINQGESYTAVFFKDDLGRGDFFNLEGESMRKAFLRAPVEFSRISSSFNLNRVHPLFKTVRPHRGIDYAAPTGTPIMASGDGIIKKAGWCGGGGNCIKIKHNSTYQTVYAHMSKFGRGIKKGVRVKQGQIIGYVGSTGLSTGPHLHYEVIVNGKKVNSQKLKLPSGKILKGEERKQFELDRLLSGFTIIGHKPVRINDFTMT